MATVSAESGSIDHRLVYTAFAGGNSAVPTTCPHLST
jgi:hypothetical protein